MILIVVMGRRKEWSGEASLRCRPLNGDSKEEQEETEADPTRQVGRSERDGHKL